MHNALNQSVRRNPTGNALSRGGIQYGGGPQPEQPPRTVMNALMQTPLRTLLEYQAAQVPNKLRSFGQAVGDSYKKTLDGYIKKGPTAMGGTAPPEEMESYAKGGLELVADVVGGGAFSSAPKGALRMFGGRSAKTADKAALQQAQDLTAKGADRNQIWKETGWYEDVDGQWKFEIDDSGAMIAPKGEKNFNELKNVGAYTNETRLGDNLWHQGLYENYPLTSEINTSLAKANFPSGSHYTSTMNGQPLRTQIQADGPSIEDIKSILLHEGQHNIQSTERFSGGGSPSNAYQSGELDAVTARIYERIKELPGNKGETKESLYKHAKKLANSEQGRMENYRRLAGEAEARNVQTRMDYTPEQRRATPPWETLDVPEDELIVRVGGGGKSMSTKPFPDTLPLTGRLRGELLNLERTETLKTAPGKVVQDLISKGHWPEELRQDALGFLNGVPARHAQRNELKSSGVDSLAYRKPGHAVENFASQKRNAERAEIEAFRKSQIVSSANELKNIDASGLWNKKFSDDINTAAESANIWGMPYIKGAVNKANMEAVPRQLKKEGWTVRHGSKGNSGRKSSRYIVSPDGKYEVRLSDHELPDTPQRQHSRDTFGAPRWNDEIVLTGGESPADVIAEVKRLYAEGLE